MAQPKKILAAQPSGKAEDCKSFIPQFESECRLLKRSCLKLINLRKNFLDILRKNSIHKFNIIIITLGAVTVVSVIVVNSFFDANPLGRTKELFGKFFLQEKKRKIQVKDWINTYNELHNDDTTGLGNRHIVIFSYILKYTIKCALFIRCQKYVVSDTCQFLLRVGNTLL